MILTGNLRGGTARAVERASILSLALCVVALSFTFGCTPENEYIAPPPPTVTVSQPLVETVTEFLDETGTTEAVEYVEIKARVRGYLDAINFESGQSVKEGDTLYVIDPKPYVAAVNQAKAALAVANARTADAEAKYKRALRAAQSGAVTEEELGERKADMQVARSEIEAAQAELEVKQLDVGYSYIKSPVTGRIGKTLVYKGNLVGYNEATHLTTIVKYDPIYATFNITERALLELLDDDSREERKGNGETKKSDVKIFLRRANDDGYPFEGRLDYADLAVDQSTGTYMIRGVFPNPDYKILPGLFVRIRVPGEKRENALLIPEVATLADQAGRYVLIVNSEDKVERKNVTLGVKYGEMVLVEKGLEKEDRVIIEGIQKARLGEVVIPTQKTLPPLNKSPENVTQRSEPPADSPAANDEGDANQ